MRKFTYSRQIETPEGVEVFTASEFDSFEEGQKAVEKGIHDRKLQFSSVKVPPSEKIILGMQQTSASNDEKTNEAGGNKKTE